MANKSRSSKPRSSKLSQKIHQSRSVSSRKYDWHTKILAGVIAFVLIGGGTFAQWKAIRGEDVADKNASKLAKNAPIRNASKSARDIDDIPPEALHPQAQIMDAGYNANSGMLPPGALPPGVTLPGMPQGGMPNAAGMTAMGMPMGMAMMQGGRTTTQGYGQYGQFDGVRQQFTGKERDAESGLDYFGARYYSSTQGRFTSVDPENAGADPADPQSWNGYAYARNNPLKYTDPDGREFRICDKATGVCQNVSDETAKQYTFNKAYQKQNGYLTKGDGNIYDTQGTVIGTYENLGDDYWNSFQRGVVNQTAENTRDPSTMMNAAIKTALSAGLIRPIKPVNLPSARKITVDMEHVASGHMDGGLRAAQNAAAQAAKKGKSLFPSWMTEG